MQCHLSAHQMPLQLCHLGDLRLHLHDPSNYYSPAPIQLRVPRYTISQLNAHQIIFLISNWSNHLPKFSPKAIWVQISTAINQRGEMHIEKILLRIRSSSRLETNKKSWETTLSSKTIILLILHCFLGNKVISG